MRDRFENQDPFARWNDPIDRDDPFKPWNDPIYDTDPTAPWNDPCAQDRDYDRWCERNGIPRWDR